MTLIAALLKEKNYSSQIDGVQNICRKCFNIVTSKHCPACKNNNLWILCPIHSNKSYYFCYCIYVSKFDIKILLVL